MNIDIINLVLKNSFGPDDILSHLDSYEVGTSMKESTWDL